MTRGLDRSFGYNRFSTDADHLDRDELLTSLINTMARGGNFLSRLVLIRLGWLFATGDARDAEILALRHQILVLQRQIDRPRFNEADRTILALLATAIGRSRRGLAFLIVRPDTVLRWHRRLVARHWTQPPATW